MLIPNGDGTHTGGPLDAICILHNVEAKTFHAAFFEESPMPGPVIPVDQLQTVRLKSKMHRTEGRTTFEEAVNDAGELAAKIRIAPENIWTTEPIGWDGAVGTVWVVPNWRKVA